MHTWTKGHPLQHRVLQVHKKFKFIDFVEGGCQDFVPEEKRSFNVEELNKEAEQYFVLLKGLICIYNESALNFHVYDYLSNNLLDGLSKEMRDAIRALAFGGDEESNKAMISEMVGEGTSSMSHDQDMFVNSILQPWAGQENQKAELEEVQERAPCDIAPHSRPIST